MSTSGLKYLDHGQVYARAAQGDLPSIIITTPRPDRDRDRAIPERLRMAPNAPVLYGHDYSELPVGKTARSEVDTTGARRAWWRWLENDDRAARVRNAYEQNMLSASIGVRPDWHEPNSFGGNDFGGEIVEFSLCAVPANPECVRGLRSLGLWSAAASVYAPPATGRRVILGTPKFFGPPRHAQRAHGVNLVSVPPDVVLELAAAPRREATLEIADTRDGLIHFEEADLRVALQRTARAMGAAIIEAAQRIPHHVEAAVRRARGKVD